MDISALTLRNLEYIASVAEQGHFGRAAVLCGVSQPALSAQVQKVEECLGMRIFERSRRKIHLTATGAEVVEQARLVLREAGRLVEIAEQRKRPLSGLFRLGVIATLGPYLMPYLLKPLREKHPDMELVLVEGLTDSLLDQLHSGRLDAVLAALPIKGNSFLTEELFLEPFYLVVPAGHTLAKAPNPSPEMLAADEMLLLEDGHCLRDQALDVCPAEGTWQQNRYQATSLETLRHMVASGAGYTLFPALAVPGSDKLKGLLRYRPFNGKAPGRTIALVWRRSGSAAGDAEALIALIRKNLPPKVKSAKP